MDVSFDPAKRALTLARRGLDLADAGLLFMGLTATRQDTRQDYGEDRFQTVGYLAGQCVMVVWTPRPPARHIITMRFVDAEEEQRWFGSRRRG